MNRAVGEGEGGGTWQWILTRCGGVTRTYISSRFREFQETQRDRMEGERGVISLREENLTLLRFEKFANREYEREA